MAGAGVCRRVDICKAALLDAIICSYIVEFCGTRAGDCRDVDVVVGKVALLSGVVICSW